MPKHLDLACPPVGAPAGLRSDATCWPLCKESNQLVRPNRPFKISPVSASTQYIWNARFATSSPYVVAFISDPPFLKWSVSKLHFGTSMPFSSEGPLAPKRSGGLHTISAD